MNLDDLSMEGLKLLLIIAIAVLGVAIGLIGYFMSKRDGAITKATENLTEAVEQLKIIVYDYKTRQPMIDERLNLHMEKLDDHEGRLTKIETEHHVYHCKK
jgi:hypothetical protein